MQDVLGLARVPGLGLHGGEPLVHLLHALVRRVEGRGRTLEELVHIVTVVATEALTNFDITKLTGGNVHVIHCRPAIRRNGGSSTTATRPYGRFRAVRYKLSRGR